jgi:hypothetical protein
MASENDSNPTFNPRRKLCSDGSCVGIIADGGKCTVCGISDAGATDSPLPFPITGDVLDEADGANDETLLESDEPAGENLPSDFDPNRRLCSDDDCIGVIGEDNRCRLCGKPAAP